jgi:putative FmdB family regulatory protein
MPRYDYRCEKCQKTFEADFPIAARDVPLEDACPLCGEKGAIERFLPSTAGLNYTAGGIKRTDAFNDLLKNIKSKHRGSTIPTK